MIIWKYEQFFSYNYDNLDETGQVFQEYKVSKLIQEEADNVHDTNMMAIN